MGARCLRRLPKGRKTPKGPEDLVYHNCLVYTEVPWRNSWTFTAGPGAPEPGGEVQHLLPDWEAAVIPIQLVSPRERRHSAKVRAFGEHVAKTMAGV
jgi:hypothetical protein